MGYTVEPRLMNTLVRRTPHLGEQWGLVPWVFAEGGFYCISFLYLAGGGGQKSEMLVWTNILAELYIAFASFFVWYRLRVWCLLSRAGRSPIFQDPVVFYLETRHPAILDGYFAIESWTRTRHSYVDLRVPGGPGTPSGSTDQSLYLSSPNPFLVKVHTTSPTLLKSI